MDNQTQETNNIHEQKQQKYTYKQVLIMGLGFGGLGALMGVASYYTSIFFLLSPIAALISGTGFGSCSWLECYSFTIINTIFFFLLGLCILPFMHIKSRTKKVFIIVLFILICLIADFLIFVGAMGESLAP